MSQGAVKRPGRGWSRVRPSRVAGDRACSNGKVRGYLRRKSVGAVIPQPRNQRPCALMDWATYRRRNAVERLINRLKQFRRIATRYEKLAANYRAMLTLSAIWIWLCDHP